MSSLVLLVAPLFFLGLRPAPASVLLAVTAACRCLCQSHLGGAVTTQGGDPGSPFFIYRVSLEKMDVSEKIGSEDFLLYSII
jgi:hypothetical protein